MGVDLLVRSNFAGVGLGRLDAGPGTDSATTCILHTAWCSIGLGQIFCLCPCLSALLTSGSKSRARMTETSTLEFPPCSLWHPLRVSRLRAHRKTHASETDQGFDSKRWEANLAFVIPVWSQLGLGQGHPTQGRFLTTLLFLDQPWTLCPFKTTVPSFDSFYKWVYSFDSRFKSSSGNGKLAKI